MTEPNDTKDAFAAWLHDSHLLNRTGIGAAVAALGLATAHQPSPGAFGVAALLALAGAVIRFWAAGIISKNRQLATTGPYAYVRNPLYTGSMLIAVAFLILNGNPIFIVPAVIGAVVLYMRTIESEEADLRDLFGADFERYRAEVPAIIPWRGRVSLDLGGETTYSLEQSLFNKEFNGIAGTVGMLVLFYCYVNWIPEATFRVGTTLIVIALMAVRGVRRANKERALRENTPAPPEAPRAEPRPGAAPDTAVAPAVGTVAPSEAADAEVEDDPHGEVDYAGDATVAARATAAGTVGAGDPFAAPERATPAGARVTASDLDEALSALEHEAEAEPEAAEPYAIDELQERLAAPRPANGPGETGPETAVDEENARAMLEQIDADEVADALGALELPEEDDRRPAAS